MSRESKLLDAIDDAEFDLEQEKKRVKAWWITASCLTALIVCCLISAAVLTLLDMDGGGPLVGSVMLTFMGGMGLLFWRSDGEFNVPRYERRLKDAQRNHRDYVIGLSEFK